MDPQERTNLQRYGQRQNPISGIQAQHFITRSLNGSYPADGETPPTNVYWVEWLKNFDFPRAIGGYIPTFAVTGEFDFVLNMEPLKYMEEGSIGLAFLVAGRWYTIDKIPASPFFTHRKYDLDGNLLWSRDHGERVEAIAIAPSGTIYTYGRDGRIKGWDASGTLIYSRDESPSGAETLRQIEIDPDGNIYTWSITVGLRKYDSAWNLLWTIATDGSQFGVDDDGNIVTCSEKKYDSTGAAIFTYGPFHTGVPGGLATVSMSAGGHAFLASFESGSTNPDKRLAEYDGSNSKLWDNRAVRMSRLKAAPLNEDGFLLAGKYKLFADQDDGGLLDLGSDKTLALFGHDGIPDWSIQRSGGDEIDVTTAGTGGTQIVVTAGLRSLNITSQGRSPTDGSLIWEADHGDTVFACDGASDHVVIGGERVTA